MEWWCCCIKAGAVELPIAALIDRDEILSVREGAGALGVTADPRAIEQAYRHPQGRS